MTEPETTLAGLRGEIDRLDDELIDLLLRRAALVGEIGSVKGANGGPILRPGRETEILRRLLARAGGRLEGAAVVRIWREIVSAAVRQQGGFSVGASMPEDGPSCWALARDQYGAALPVQALAGPAQVAAAVAEGRISVGVVPYPVGDEPQPWWPLLTGDSAPRVVARLPAAQGFAPADGCSDGLALASILPEPSGEDRSLIAVETEKGTGRTPILAGFDAAGFTVRGTWTHPAKGDNPHDATLAEVDGFAMPDGPGLAELAEALGAAVSRISVIGAFAVPPVIAAPAQTPRDGGSGAS